MDEVPLSPPLPSSPVAPHPRLVPPSLVPVLKANIAFPDATPQVIRWSRELEELFYLLSWSEWYDLLDDHQADLDILQGGTATPEEEEAAYGRYNVRMDQVLAVYYSRKSYIDEETRHGVTHARQQARLNRFEWAYMSSLAERDAMEEMCLNPQPRSCTPPPAVCLLPATPLSVRTKRSHDARPDTDYLLPAPLELLLADSLAPNLEGLSLDDGEDDSMSSWGSDGWEDEPL